MITQKDIAEKLNVSQKTVSRVINGDVMVDDMTRKIILEEVGKSKYKVNPNARNLVRKRSGSISVLIETSRLSSIYFLKSFQGMCEVLEDQGIHFSLSTFSSNADCAKLLNEQLLTCDGFVFFNFGSIRSDIKKLGNKCKRNGKSLLLIQECKREDDLPFLSVDNFDGGYQATQYLLDAGHRKVAFFGSQSFNKSTEGGDRLLGYKDALKNAGIKFDKSYVINNHHLKMSDSVDELLKIPKKSRPTAVFCFADLHARLLIIELQKRGFDVPKDFSVIGFDGKEAECMMMYPFLTTIEQPFYDLGKAASEYLIGKINNKKVKARRQIKPILVVREST